MKKTPLKQKAQLSAAKPLQAKTALKASEKPKRRPRKPLEKKSAPQLVKLADTYYSRYIRLRDSKVMPSGGRAGMCITCSRWLVVLTIDGRWVAGAQNGHYVTRGNHALRYDDENCNLQCAHCNAWLDKVQMITAYTEALDKKYGAGTAVRLTKVPDAYSTPRKELLQIIEDTKRMIAYIQEND